MAAGLLTHIAKEQGKDWNVQSAGLAHSPGARVATGAAAVLAELGIDITSEFSKPVTSQKIEWADVIMPMTSRQMDYLLEVFPASKSKIRYLGTDVPDPYLKPVAEYRKVRDVLNQSLTRFVTSIAD
jgi:arsenate reductase